MSGWIQRTLFEVSPSNEKGLSFYYLPLSGEQQDTFRAKAIESGSAQEFTTAVFCARTLIFKVTTDAKGEQYFTWPDEIEDQHVILSQIPPQTILEVGSIIMGYQKRPEEDASVFRARVLHDLGETDDPFEV